jgi:alanine racemase
MMTTSENHDLFRPAWATIDLAAVAQNYDVILSALSPRARVMAMVKADAYGHGAVEVSRKLEERGVRALGVATVEEGVELRAAGIRSQILVMGGLMGMGSPASQKMVEARLTPVIHSSGVLASIEQAAAAAGTNVAVHLKIDTGMSRLGVRPEALPAVLARLQECSHLCVEGVMTHLADAADETFTALQMESFRACHQEIAGALGAVRIWHIANSIAAIRGWPVEIDHAEECWVRPGLALYGEVDLDHPLRAELQPAMALESRVMLLKRVPAGTAVSYGCTFRTARPTRLAIIPIGYADGYPWALSGKASVLVRGKRLPVVGRVTMDMIIVDVTDLADVVVGDSVILMGADGKDRISVREWASWAGTIPYEIFCDISKRMPRVYRDT